jgi:MerR family transcriptional regulator, thiopeptide resistance regulator
VHGVDSSLPGIIEEPVDQRYGVREYGARHLEGQPWYFHSALDRYQ